LSIFLYTSMWDTGKQKFHVMPGLPDVSLSHILLCCCGSPFLVCVTGIHNRLYWQTSFFPWLAKGGQVCNIDVIPYWQREGRATWLYKWYGHLGHLCLSEVVSCCPRFHSVG